MDKLFPTIAICGPGRSGKDTAARYLTAITTLRLGRTTSQVIAPHIALEDGISVEEAFERRHEERERWFTKGNALRQADPAHLVRECLRDGEIVVGLRNTDEVLAARNEGLVDLFVWIDRIVQRDPTMQFDSRLCDVIVENNGTVAELERKLDALAKFAGLC